MAPNPPDPQALRAAAQALAEGGLVVYPTDTLYGLGCQASHAEAFDRLTQVKGLPSDRGVSCVFAGIDQARAWTRWTPTAQALAEAFLPGPMTLILDATPACPDHLLGPEGTLGVRHVDRPATLALCEQAPVVSTSANRHGQPSATTIPQAREIFGDAVDAYVDAGALTGPASTVVDAREKAPKVIREGPLTMAELEEVVALG